MRDTVNRNLEVEIKTKGRESNERVDRSSFRGAYRGNRSGV